MTHRWELNLPYIAPPLSLNGREHWAAKDRKRKQLQSDVAWIAKAHRIPTLGHATIWLEWTPAVARRRDTDNLEATRKVCVDALVSIARVLPDDTPKYVSRPENVIKEPQRSKPSLLLVIEGSALSKAGVE